MNKKKREEKKREKVVLCAIVVGGRSTPYTVWIAAVFVKFLHDSRKWCVLDGVVAHAMVFCWFEIECTTILVHAMQ